MWADHVSLIRFAYLLSHSNHSGAVDLLRAELARVRYSDSISSAEALRSPADMHVLQNATVSRSSNTDRAFQVPLPNISDRIIYAEFDRCSANSDGNENDLDLPRASKSAQR